MQFIIEGGDATGKTTLAERLAEKYNCTVHHLGAEDPICLEFHLDLLEKQNIIYDRFHISEMVYQQLYSRAPRLSFEDYCDINDEVVKNGTIVIILFSSDMSIIKDRLIERGELNYLSEVDEQNKLFMKWAHITDVYEDMRLKVIDIAKEDAFDKICKYIEVQGIK